MAGSPACLLICAGTGPGYIGCLIGCAAVVDVFTDPPFSDSDKKIPFEDLSKQNIAQVKPLGNNGPENHDKETLSLKS